MKCPACSNQLKTIDAESIQVDVCEGGCGGIWFDPSELEHFDEPSEFNSAPLKNIRRAGGALKIKETMRGCPRCEDETMAQLFVDPSGKIRIDQCFKCGGIWFDAGELKSLVAQYKNAEERKRAVEQYADECLENHREVIKQAGQNRMAKFYDATENHLKGFLYFFQHMI